MVFKFLKDQDSEENGAKSAESSVTPLREAEEIPVASVHQNLADSVDFCTFQSPSADSVIIKYLNLNTLINDDHGKVEAKALELARSSSDLLSGTYEGGFKVWECTVDLIEYLNKSYDFKGKRVLDVGCGSGLLGIYALNGDAAAVHFQDYNSEVTSHLTIPNTLLNVGLKTLKEKCRFYAGDWSSFTTLLCNRFGDSQSEKYDCVLTSETIYNLEYLQKLVNLFKTVLKSDGVIFVAAKSMYFGVGGGTQAFLKCVSDSGLFDAEIVHAIKEGVHRDIIQLKFRS